MTQEKLSYETMMDRLGEEKKKIQRELKKDYRKSRKFVRANPEKGMVTAFLTGLVTGIIITKLFPGK